jgi:N-acetylneuraminate epimerase
MNRRKQPRPCEATARALLLCATLFAARPATAGANPMPSPFTLESLPALPDPEGFAGMFAGVTHGALLVAGGANIPKNRWQDPIQKSWYNSVWILEKSGTSWIPTSPLPEPLAYGVSVTIPEGVLCIGGSSPDRHHTAVFALTWENRTLTTRSYPPLPSPCANACAALVGRTVFVAGGTTAPSDTTALRQFLALDLDHLEAGWQQLPPWPGPGRILGVAGSADGGFHLFSGVSLSRGPEGHPVRTYLRDAFRYRPGRGWETLPDLPHACAAAPSPAVPTPEESFFIPGGDAGSHTGFTPLDQHPGFSRNLLAYSSRKNTWSITGQLPFSTVTAPAVPWEGRTVIISGEIRPRVRTPEVRTLSFTIPAP